MKTTVRRAATTIAVLVVAGGASVAAAQELEVLDHKCDVDFPGCVDSVQGLRGAHDLVFSPDGKHVYVVSTLDDALLTFDFDDQTGQLSHADSFFDTDSGIDGLDGARGVAISPDGKHVYVAALSDRSISTYSRNAPTGLLTYEGSIFDGAGVDGLAGATEVVVSPDGEHVYVAGRSEDAVAVFSRDETTGALSFAQSVARPSLDAVEGLAISPDGKHLYAAAEEASAVTVFRIDAEDGSLAFGQELLDGRGRLDGFLGAGQVAVSPDGKHVYVGAEVGQIDSDRRNDDDWAAVFARNARTGRLRLVQVLEARDFGEPSFSGLFANCSGVGPSTAHVTLSPDGQLVYLTHPFAATVAVFARHPRTGRLTLASARCLGELTVDGIFSGARDVITSPDGTYVLTADLGGSSVVVLGPGEEPSTDVELLAPVGGEALPTGQATVIRWDPHPDAVRYHVYLSQNGGRRFRRIGRNLPGRLFVWNVPFQRANNTDVVVKVTAIGARNRRLGESSSAPLAVEALDVSAPQGGATLTSGEVVTITWEARGTRRPVASVLLRYTTNGRRFRTIELLSGDPGSYEWTVPAVTAPEPRSKVKVILRDSRRRTLAAVATDALTIEPAP